MQAGREVQQPCARDLLRGEAGGCVHGRGRTWVQLICSNLLERLELLCALGPLGRPRAARRRPAVEAKPSVHEDAAPLGGHPRFSELVRELNCRHALRGHDLQARPGAGPRRGARCLTMARGGGPCGAVNMHAEGMELVRPGPNRVPKRRRGGTVHVLPAARRPLGPIFSAAAPPGIVCADSAARAFRRGRRREASNRHIPCHRRSVRTGARTQVPSRDVRRGGCLRLESDPASREVRGLPGGRALQDVPNHCSWGSSTSGSDGVSCSGGASLTAHARSAVDDRCRTTRSASPGARFSAPISTGTSSPPRSSSPLPPDSLASRRQRASHPSGGLWPGRGSRRAQRPRRRRTPFSCSLVSTAAPGTWCRRLRLRVTFSRAASCPGK